MAIRRNELQTPIETSLSDCDSSHQSCGKKRSTWQRWDGLDGRWKNFWHKRIDRNNRAYGLQGIRHRQPISDDFRYPYLDKQIRFYFKSAGWLTGSFKSRNQTKVWCRWQI